MKNIAIIPVKVEEGEVDPLAIVVNSNPVRPVTLLDQVYSAANSCDLIDTVIVTSDSREVAEFCKQFKLHFFPSSNGCVSGTNRCAEVASRLREDANIGNIICWPLSEPTITVKDVTEMIAKHTKNNISTMARSVPKSEIDDFMSDSSKVKLRVITQTQLDFTRCPLPMALQHIGIYMFSLDMLKSLCKIEPTKLSKSEGLEQLTWMQYNHEQSTLGLKIAIHTISASNSTEHISVHNLRDLERLIDSCTQSNS